MSSAPGRRNYNIPFAAGNDQIIKGVFAARGIGDGQKDQNIRKMAGQGLLAIAPLGRSSLYHREYARQAIGSLPPLGNFRSRRAWLQAALASLNEFATSEYARSVIAREVGDYYGRIAQLAIDIDGQPYLPNPAKIEAHQVRPLDYVGISPRDTYLDHIARHRKTRARRAYVPLLPTSDRPHSGVATFIKWSLPGVQEIATQAAVLAHLRASNEPTQGAEGLIVSPEKLFFAGKIALGEDSVPVSRLFSSPASA